MTASDPAVAAAFRVAEDWGGPYDIGAGVEAAREALAPLRELHKPTSDYSGASVCDHCLGDDTLSAPWPCATAKLVYPPEEL
ncbi:hypothetical protein [Tsukamurella sp. USMM236]|uniref:hypothetical protein n=1 Tax=Tsukamurella sp. USMM236 TaxID=3081301 RepID=UPI00301AA74A